MTPQPHGKRLDSVNTRETHNHICSRDMGFLVYAVCENKARIEDNWTNLVLCTESVESPAPGVRMARVLPQNLSHLSFKIERVESARPIQSTCHELNFLHLGSLHKTFFIARWFWYIGQWCVGRFSGCNFHLPPSFDVITDSLKQLLHRISYCRIWTEPFTTFCSRGKSCRWKFPIYAFYIIFSQLEQTWSVRFTYLVKCLAVDGVMRPSINFSCSWKLDFCKTDLLWLYIEARATLYWGIIYQKFIRIIHSWMGL